MARQAKEIEELTRRVEVLEALERFTPQQQRIDPAIALGTDLVDLGNSPSIRLRQTTQQSLSNDITTQLSLQVTDWDTMNGADLVNNEIIVRRSALYMVMGGVVYVANNTGARFAGWAVNDAGASERLRQASTPGSVTSARPSFCDITNLMVGDTVQLMGHQISGGNLQTNPANAAGGIPFLALVLIADLPSNLS